MLTNESSLMRNYTTFLLCMTVFFLFADQNLLAPNLSAIAEDFHFDSHERDEKLGGYIAFGFFIVGAPVALIVGYFTDIVNRCYLFGLVVAFGEAASVATYWVKTYEQLFIYRVLTGISIGGATPIIFSILGDLFSGSSRIYVATLIGISQSAGVSVGQFVSGMIGPVYGWRAPFLIMSIPAILCAIIVVVSVDEPLRGEQEKAVKQFRAQKQKTTEIEFQTDHNIMNPISDSEEPSKNIHVTTKVSYTIQETEFENNRFGRFSSSSIQEPDDFKYEEKIDWSKIKKIFSTPSTIIIFVQGFPGCLPWGMIFVFLNDYFSEERNMSVENATAALTCFGVGGLFGQLFGGWCGQKLYNKDPRFQTLLMGSSTLISTIPMLYLINTPKVGDLGFYFMACFAGFSANINGPNVRVVLQNVSIPEIRGTAFAFFSLADDIGKGLGPALVVVFINAFQGDRREAFNTIVFFWIFCGMLLLLLSLTVIDDEKTAQSTIKNSLLTRSALSFTSQKINETICDIEKPSENELYNRPTISSPNRHDLTSSDICYIRIIDENVSNAKNLPGNVKLESPHPKSTTLINTMNTMLTNIPEAEVYACEND